MLQTILTILATIMGPIALHLFFTADFREVFYTFSNMKKNTSKKLKRSESQSDQKYDRSFGSDQTLLLLINLTWIISLGFVTSLLKIKYSAFFYLPLILFFFYIVFNMKTKDNLIRKILDKRMWVAFGFSLFSYGPELINSMQKGQLLGMSSQRNNDVVYYALTAKAYLENGFANNFQVMNQDLNEAALRYQHQGANQITSFTSEFLRLPPYKSMNIIALFLILETILVLAKIIMVLWKNCPFFWAATLATSVLTSPIVNYIYSNYFLGQMTGILLACIMTMIICKFATYSIQPKELFLLILTSTILSIYLYPTFLIPFLAFTLAFIIVFDRFPSKAVEINRQKTLLRKRAISGFILGTICSLPYLPFAVNFVLILNKGDYGWPIRPIDPLSIFVSNKFIDLEIPSSTLVITSWALLFLVLIIVSKNSSFIPFALKLSFLPIGLAVSTYVYLIGGGNWGHYQNWKLLSYFIPFFLVIFYTSLAARRGVGRIILVPLLVMSLSAPYISWLPILKGKVPSNVLTRDQVNVLNSGRLNILKFENISVSMPTWFETMAMANILENEHIYLISPSYLPILDPDPTHCVLEHISLTDSNKPFLATDYQVSLPNGKSCD